MDLFVTSIHRDGSVTFWNVYTQCWVKHVPASDLMEDHRILATLSPEDRAMIEFATHLENVK